MKNKPDDPDWTPPKCLGTAGKAYWQRVVTEFELEPHHSDLLLAAAKQLDRLTEARAIIAKEGLVYKDRWGAPKPHPAVAIERDATTVFLKCQREMSLDIEVPELRGPRRPGA